MSDCYRTSELRDEPGISSNIPIIERPIPRVERPDYANAADRDPTIADDDDVLVIDDDVGAMAVAEPDSPDVNVDGDTTPKPTVTLLTRQESCESPGAMVTAGSERVIIDVPKVTPKSHHKSKKMKMALQPSPENCGLAVIHGIRLPYVIRDGTRYFVRNHLRLVFSRHRQVTAAHFGVMCNSMCHSEICTNEEKCSLICLSAQIGIQVKNSSRLISEYDAERAYNWMVNRRVERPSARAPTTSYPVVRQRSPKFDKRMPKKKPKPNKVVEILSTDDIRSKNEAHFNIGGVADAETTLTASDNVLDESSRNASSSSSLTISPATFVKGQFFNSLKLFKSAAGNYQLKSNKNNSGSADQCPGPKLVIKSMCRVDPIQHSPPGPSTNPTQLEVTALANPSPSNIGDQHFRPSPSNHGPEDIFQPIIVQQPRPVGVPSWTVKFEQPPGGIKNWLLPGDEGSAPPLEQASGWSPPPQLVEAAASDTQSQLTNGQEKPLDLSVRKEDVASGSTPVDTSRRGMLSYKQENTLLWMEVVQLRKNKVLLIRQLNTLRGMYHGEVTAHQRTLRKLFCDEKNE